MVKFKFPSNSSKNLDEKRLGTLLSGYVTPANRNYDPYFEKELKEKFGFQHRNFKSKYDTINDIEQFYKNNGYLPNKRSLNIEESKLGMACISFRSVGSKHYDKDFAKKHKNSLTWNDFKQKQIAQDFIKFISENRFLPYKTNKNPVIDKLALWYSAAIVRGSLPTVVVKAIEKLEIISYRQYKVNKVAQEVIAYYNINGKPPAPSKNITEDKLSNFIINVKGGNVQLPKEFKQLICSMKTIPEILREQRGLPKGVSRLGKRFRASVGKFHLGTFNTIEAASAAVEKAKKINEI